MDSKIKIATININKLKSEEKRRRLFKFCQIRCHIQIRCHMFPRNEF